MPLPSSCPEFAREAKHFDSRVQTHRHMDADDEEVGGSFHSNTRSSRSESESVFITRPPVSRSSTPFPRPSATESLGAQLAIYFNDLRTETAAAEHE